jgi:hypothetical protein
MDLVTEALQNFSRRYIREDGIMDANIAQKKLEEFQPHFRNDKIFQDCFEICFNIELCKFKLEQKEA